MARPLEIVHLFRESAEWRRECESGEEAEAGTAARGDWREVGEEVEWEEQREE